MTAELVRPYCTREELQSELRNADESLNGWFDECINRASRRVEEFCNTDFWYHDHSSSGFLIPNEWIVGRDIFFPWAIQASPAVEISYTETAAVISTEDYTVYGGINAASGNVERFGLIKTGLYFCPTGHRQMLTIKAKFGTTLSETQAESSPPTNLPVSVGRACVLIAAAWSMRNQKQIIGLGGERAELFSNEVPKEAKSLLTRWKVNRAQL